MNIQHKANVHIHQLDRYSCATPGAMLAVYETMMDMEHPCTIVEIAHATGWPATEVRLILKAMEARNEVRRVRDAKHLNYNRYVLTISNGIGRRPLMRMPNAALIHQSVGGAA